MSYLYVSDGILIHGLELPRTLFILPEVSLAANQDDRSVPTEVSHLWEPLVKENFQSFYVVVFFNFRLDVVLHDYSICKQH